MSYHRALEAAGATVHDFEHFGSYQGDWWARVTYKGETGFVRGSFGSCSYCDAFEAEFGYDDDEWCDQHAFRPLEDCLGCQEAKAKYQDRLKSFGAPYLDGLYSTNEAIKSASEDLEWDSEAQRMVDWIKARAQ